MLRISILIVVLLATVSPGLAQDFPTMPTIAPPDLPTAPTPIVTPTIPAQDAVIGVDDVPHSEIYNFLATAVANVNSLPDDLSRPNGTSLIPDETATQLFGFAKWLFSDAAARELLGDTLAPIGINLYILLSIVVVLAVVWVTLKIAVLIIRFVQYAAGWILRILPFVG